MCQASKQPTNLLIEARRRQWRCRSAKIGSTGENAGVKNVNNSNKDTLKSLMMTMILNTVHETDDSRYYYSSLMDLACQKVKEGKCREAKSIYYQALVLARHHCRASFMATRAFDNMDYEDSLDLANTLQDMGNVCFRLGELTEARLKLVEALDLKRQYYRELQCLNHRLPLFKDRTRDQSGTKKSSSTGGFMTRTTSNLQEITNLGKASMHGESGVASEPSSPEGKFSTAHLVNVHYSDNCERKNLDIATILEDLGRVSKALHDFDSAIKYYHEALDLKRLFYGKLSRIHVNSHGQLNLKQQAYGYDVAQNVDIANLNLRLAELAHLQGKYHTARKRYAGALDIFQKAYGGRHHTDTAVVLLHLYQVNSDMQRQSYANQFLKLAFGCIEGLKNASNEKIVNESLSASIVSSSIIIKIATSLKVEHPCLHELQALLSASSTSDDLRF